MAWAIQVLKIKSLMATTCQLHGYCHMAQAKLMPQSSHVVLAIQLLKIKGRMATAWQLHGFVNMAHVMQIPSEFVPFSLVPSPIKDGRCHSFPNGN